MITSQAPDGTAPTTPSPGPITQAVVWLVLACSRLAWPVVIIAALVSWGAAHYSVTHFAINTNTADFISARLPWRQNLLKVDKTFPERSNQIVVVVDGKTPELAEAATAQLTARMKAKPDLFQFVARPEGGDYFNRNGLLFLPTPVLKETLQGLFRAQPFLSNLSADPSLRGIADSMGFITKGVRSEAGTFDDFDRPMAALNPALEGVLAGKPVFFSWRSLVSGEAPDPRELRRFILAQPVLDYSALKPGEVPSDFIRATSRELGLTEDKGVNVRLTGPVPLADEEFSTVADGIALNSALTAFLVMFLIWRAVHSFKIVIAVALSVTVGLLVTAAVGLMMVGALNLISVAFAVLFVGIGVDFGIQFSVRYRAERYANPDFTTALTKAAIRVSRPLSLAAIATAAGFYSFLPTDYRGVSELGLIAGTGMFIAFAASITVLPALLTLIKPPPEKEPVGYLFLAPVDEFLTKHRYFVVFGTLALALAATPLLAKLRFDFNPINLRNPKVESVATLLDLMRHPDTDTNTINILAPSLDATVPLVERLEKLPVVARVTTLNSLVPPDQEEKLPLIEKAATQLGPMLDPGRRLDKPTDAEDIAGLRKAASAFTATAGDTQGKGADDARRLAKLLNALADAPAEVREAARKALLPGLDTMLDLLRQSLSAKKTTVATIPTDLTRLWVAANGSALIEVAPKGDPNDNQNLVRFSQAVQQIAPDATGEPIALQESGKTVVQAFLQAGTCAFLSIAVLLWIVLRRVSDVLMTLVPLLLAGVVTLELTVLLGLPLNFANIIALPLLLGLGVAFKIYFVMAWRAGTTHLLQSSLTRAVFFSAMTTAVAFGSLWLSNHPGTSSMGKLLALSLVCTLLAAILFQPALMGPPRHPEAAPQKEN
ncbi:MMPL family transporter [Beijerinckia indica]|uniref:Hopanoid biosynthesis associated RND transporter like protein HpnN n=1 Tax=Beijerinckia indica subsp. indica (strain ATCC 9039 / DSM 1715 / NCIMB 8712) TaxID=395963 RepID=B2ICC3_BEII9|nr:MMPL family transporter [Beijerinckia indica]ACB96720.1 hopanoid biosynthesis associated RND transporter like protein HpnN [Beijerinckia indica subsp. indica ATCC 9039]